MHFERALLWMRTKMKTMHNSDLRVKSMVGLVLGDTRQEIRSHLIDRALRIQCFFFVISFMLCVFFCTPLLMSSLRAIYHSAAMAMI